MLTIAIPFYYGQAYLRRAIESVLAQGYGDFRLIVSDDNGSETGTESLVRSFEDSRVAYFRNERNLGMAGNWNRCLELAETDLVTILHSDDLLLPKYLQIILAASQRHPRAALFFCEARIIDSQGESCFSFPDYIKRFFRPKYGSEIVLQGQSGLAAILRGNFIMCPSVCYRKSVLGTRRFSPDWKFALDIEFFSRMLGDGERLVGVPDVAYAYRRHSGNATSAYTKSLLRYKEEVELYCRLSKVARVKNWKQVERIADQKNIIKLNLSFQMLMDGIRLQISGSLTKAQFLASIF